MPDEVRARLAALSLPAVAALADALRAEDPRVRVAAAIAEAGGGNLHAARTLSRAGSEEHRRGSEVTEGSATTEACSSEWGSLGSSRRKSPDRAIASTPEIKAGGRRYARAWHRCRRFASFTVSDH